jgi:hypothetical protein
MHACPPTTAASSMPETPRAATGEGLRWTPERSPSMPPPRQPGRARRAAQPPRRQPPLDHARISAYRDHRCLRAPRAALPPPRPRERREGAAYPDLITVASHTKKDNPAGLPSRPSSSQTTSARRYVFTPRVAGQRGSELTVPAVTRGVAPIVLMSPAVPPRLTGTNLGGRNDGEPR